MGSMPYSHPIHVQEEMERDRTGRVRKENGGNRKRNERRK